MMTQSVAAVEMSEIESEALWRGAEMKRKLQLLRCWPRQLLGNARTMAEISAALGSLELLVDQAWFIDIHAIDRDGIVGMICNTTESRNRFSSPCIVP